VIGDYRAEADALDAEIFGLIERWSTPSGYRGRWDYSDPGFDFNELALRIFDHQLRFNAPYARYCSSLGITSRAQTHTWQNVPPVPAGAFKEAALCTFDPGCAELIFQTSGTTTGAGGVHYMESARLYDASLLAGFNYALLRDARDPLRYCMLLPSLEQKPRSSLTYMMDRVAKTFGDGKHSWYVDGDTIEPGRFIEDIRDAQKSDVPLCIAGTAFAFVNVLDELARPEARPALPLPSGSRIMETGGFKGRTRTIDRTRLYKLLADVFSLPAHDIVGEYGMTELTSQYYDYSFDEMRSKGSPPWLRSYAVDEHGKQVPPGIVGALVHVDLANRSSCVAIQTEDLGAVFEDGSLALVGRDRGAELRGCSLDAESLRAAAS
jgi:hypothetical protein